MCKAYKRWRHSRGYGVHSPFAYYMVKEVIRPRRGYEYYGYRNINEAWLGMPAGERRPHMRRHARMLLRLVARLDAQSVYIPKGFAAIPFVTAMKCANSDITIVSALADANHCDIIASTGNFVNLESLQRLIAKPGRILVMRDVPKGWREALFDHLQHGLLLYSKDSLILVNRPQMAKVSYSVNL